MTIDFDSYVILWSPKQEVFHIEIIADMLKINRKILELGNKSDFIPLDFYRTHDEALDAIVKLENMAREDV